MNKLNKNVTFQKAFLRKQNITTVDFDGELAIMDVNKGVYYYMNSIGSEIWEIIHKAATTEEIVHKLILQYDIDEETCRDQVRDFLEELIDRDLVLILG